MKTNVVAFLRRVTRVWGSVSQVALITLTSGMTPLSSSQKLYLEGLRPRTGDSGRRSHKHCFTQAMWALAMLFTGLICNCMSVLIDSYCSHKIHEWILNFQHKSKLKVLFQRHRHQEVAAVQRCLLLNYKAIFMKEIYLGLQSNKCICCHMYTNICAMYIE